uniref:Transthyretin-like family protein n=1 Tax=Rhabditophanes sp. KR3021 TaxID=114890 RepID=A0AC35TP19_9BILA
MKSKSINVILTILLVQALLFDCINAEQTVGVRGRLMCGTSALANTKIKLWNKHKIGSDQQLASVSTDAKGNFEVTGRVTNSILPNIVLKAYHDCSDGKPCQRKVYFGVPNKYVTKTDLVSKWFDLGTINMQIQFPDEERSCIN